MKSHAATIPQSNPSWSDYVVSLCVLMGNFLTGHVAERPMRRPNVNSIALT
jgi:hypothetical protein